MPLGFYVIGKWWKTARCQGGRASAQSGLPVLEVFHLPQALLGFGLALVRPAQILSLLGHYFVAIYHFFNHFSSPPVIFFVARIKSMHESL
jgi:hypothetical protein